MDRNVKKDEQRKWLLGKLKKLEAVKYPLLVLLLGAGLLLIPWGGGNTEQAAKPIQTEETVDLAAELEALLTQLEGAGEVRVLLTVAEGVSHTYQTDLQTSADGTTTERQEETVLVSDGAGGETPITRTTTYPTYQGAVVLCQGADSAAVRLNIIKAVSSLTGLGSDRITVMKMKR